MARTFAAGLIAVLSSKSMNLRSWQQFYWYWKVIRGTEELGSSPAESGFVVLIEASNTGTGQMASYLWLSKICGSRPGRAAVNWLMMADLMA